MHDGHEEEERDAWCVMLMHRYKWKRQVILTTHSKVQQVKHRLYWGRWWYVRDVARFRLMRVRASKPRRVSYWKSSPQWIEWSAMKGKYHRESIMTYRPATQGTKQWCIRCCRWDTEPMVPLQRTQWVIAFPKAKVQNDIRSRRQSFIIGKNMQSDILWVCSRRIVHSE